MQNKYEQSQKRHPSQTPRTQNPFSTLHRLLIVHLTRTILQLMSSLLVHLLIRRVRQEDKCTNNQHATHDSRRCKWRVERRREELVDDGDDEDCEQGGDGGEYRGGEGD